VSPRQFFSPAEKAMLDHARPSERVIVRDLFELLDARLIEGGSSVVPGDLRELGSSANDPAKRAPSTEPLFHTRREDAA
jgi:hypothetical protein